MNLTPRRQSGGIDSLEPKRVDGEETGRSSQCTANSIDNDSSKSSSAGSKVGARSLPTRSNGTKVSTEDIENARELERGAHSEFALKHVKNVMPFSDSNRVKVISNEQIERVRMMHDRFADGSEFNFNYNTLLLVASILAGLGLVSNSATTVIASMLVSPIMGPVVGMAYGATIRDYKLIKKSLTTELVSLFVCVCMGGIIGVCISFTKNEESEDWPTAEMVARGKMSNFYYALPVAFFSGLGVAVSLLDEQTNSLVGVAISASLLPPAVNAGVLWISWALLGHDEGEDQFEWEGCEKTECKTKNFIYMGTVSFCITLANVALIIVSSMVMFRLKEKLPIKKKVFWNDLGVARKIYRGYAVTAPAATRNLNALPSMVAGSPVSQGGGDVDDNRGMTVIAEEASSEEDGFRYKQDEDGSPV